MRVIGLKVNGEAREVPVEPRTQLAEILRDKLHLTGTHLGCEQGVCGACTVMVDGKPVRSCIFYAGACDGIEVETIEGFADDAVMDDLRSAFSRHHALQCGFCTPGMLVTARDIVLRLGTTDPQRIRSELSGNLCRCTGYVGIVSAITEVIKRHAGSQTQAEGSSKPALTTPRHGRHGFVPFEISPVFLIPEKASLLGAGTTVIGEDGWVSVARSFTLAHPLEPVWNLFESIEAIGRCIPGVEIDTVHGNSFRGGLRIRFGPIDARFAGDGSRTSDEGSRCGTIAGTGKEANGRSDVRSELRYRLAAAEALDRTDMVIELRYRLQGSLAQFNREDLIESFVDLVLRQFISNCDRTLSGEALQDGGSLSAFGLLGELVRNKFKRVYRWLRS